MEAREIFRDASMVLTKLNSNSALILDRAPMSSRDSPPIFVSVLGMRWFSQEDCFNFSFTVAEDVKITKRVILGYIARLYDPLGFISPFVVLAKCLFQTIWQLGLDWDDVVPKECACRFLRWLSGFPVLGNLKIRRCFLDSGWSNLDGLEIHSFGDASEGAYGAVVYLGRRSATAVQFSLVMSRARVAPLKRVTLPRLELLASLLAARLLVFVRASLELPDSVFYRCWTDSKVVLAWVKGSPNNWKQFVGNRVAEIHSLTDPSHWHHVAGADNPADLLTRGLFADELVKKSEWVCGPPWLYRELTCADSAVCLPVCNETPADNSSTPLFTSVICFSKFSSLIRVLRVTSFVLRFISLLRKRLSCIGDADRDQSSTVSYQPATLSFDEITTAKWTVIRLYQQENYSSEYSLLKTGKNINSRSSIYHLRPFLDVRGLIRSKRRLDNADLSYDEKNPIIIPKGHLAVLIVRHQHYVLKHAGVDLLISSIKSIYHVVGLRRLCKRVNSGCVVCQRFDKTPCNAPFPPLPGLRVNPAPPFSITGVDFAGPLYCTDLPNTKCYICLFTCGVVRALHLELTKSLSTDEFALAFRRFVSRRGWPSVIYSDNALTFVAISRALPHIFGGLSPSWKFIAPRAPWWGGFWERMVRSVKSSLRKCLGRRSVSSDALYTMLCEIEYCVNSRPLTYVSADADSDQVLTPNHLIFGRSPWRRFDALSESELIPDSLCSSFSNMKLALQRFWDMWRKDYLRSLPPVVGKTSSPKSLMCDDVVLIEEHNVPRVHWLMGVVEGLHPGSDGEVRAVDVRTHRGVLTRPIQRLRRLELDAFPL